MALQKKSGRMSKLIIALLILGGSTAGIAFLPTYDKIGPLSILLLAILRIGQGIAIGGSWDGLPSLLAINAPENKRGTYAMIGQLGAPIGFIIATSMFWYFSSDMPSEEFLDWGWRFPFFIAILFNSGALYFRLRLLSTPEFKRLLEANDLQPCNINELVRTQKHNLLIGALAALASYALFHLVTVFPLSWISIYRPKSASDFLGVEILGAIVATIGILASGPIADKYGRRNTLAIMALLIAAFSGFAPILLSGSNLGQNLFTIIGFGLLGLSYGQASGAVASNFPTKFRYTGAALTSDLAWLFGAGFAPLIVLGLSTHYGLSIVSIYLLSGAISTLAILGINRKLEISNLQ
jgi:MFS family permease